MMSSSGPEPTPAWHAPAAACARPTAAEVAGWVVLLVWLWVSRLHVAPAILFEWDSANYALGIADLDVFNHQPHPPGYPIYTLLLRGLSLLAPSETGPFLLANGLFGSATLFLLGWMLRRSCGPLIALLTAAAFSVCPQFWHQGAVSTAYVAECFCSVSCMAVALALVRGQIPAHLAALLTALLLGIRPSGALSFTPVLFLAGLMRWPGWAGFARAAGAFCVGCALWFFPLVAFGGGWDRYWEATSALYTWQRNTAAAVSPLLNGAVLLRFLADGLNLLLLAVGLNLAIHLWQRRSRRGLRSVTLLLVWFMPGALIYTFYHLAKSGYVLTLMPVPFVAGALALVNARRRLPRYGRRALLIANGVIVALYVVLNVGAFYMAVPAELVRRQDAHMGLPDKVRLLGDYGRHGLRYQTYPQQRVREILADLDQRKDLSIFLFGAHELHRIAMVHHPTHRLIAASLGHQHALYSPPTPHWPGTFGDFQSQVLQPMQYEPSPPRATCVHAAFDRLIIARGKQELELELRPGSAPRRLVIFYPGPSHRLRVGDGMVPVRERHVGRGFHAWEFRPVGLDGTLDLAVQDPAARRGSCEFPGGTKPGEAAHSKGR